MKKNGLLISFLFFVSVSAYSQCGTVPVVWVYGYSCTEGSAVFYGGNESGVNMSTVKVYRYDGYGNYTLLGNLGSGQFTFNEYHRAGNGFPQSYFFYRFNYGSGCTSSYAPVEVDDKFLPVPTITGNTTPCNGTSLSFTVSPDIYGDGNYRWYDSQGTLLSTSNHFVGSSGYSTLYVSGFAANDYGCESDRAVVNIHYPASPQFPVVTPIVCQLEGSSITLNAYLPNATSYRWYNADYEFLAETATGSYTVSFQETSNIVVAGVVPCSGEGWAQGIYVEVISTATVLSYSYNSCTATTATINIATAANASLLIEKKVSGAWVQQGSLITANGSGNASFSAPGITSLTEFRVTPQIVDNWQCVAVPAAISVPPFQFPQVWVYGYSCKEGEAVFYGGTASGSGVNMSNVKVFLMDGPANHIEIGNLANGQFTYGEYHREGNGFVKSHFVFQFKYGSNCYSNYTEIEVEDKFLQAPVVSGNSRICKNGSVNLTASVYSESEYRWYNSNGTLLSGTGSNFVLNGIQQSTFFEVEGIATNDFGCPSPRTRMNITVIDPSPGWLDSPTLISPLATESGSYTISAQSDYATIFKLYDSNHIFIAQNSSGIFSGSINDDSRFYVSGYLTSCNIETGATSVDVITGSNRNFIKTTFFKKEGVIGETEIAATLSIDKNVTLDYYDGLGRPEQTLIVKNSPSQRDIVQLTQFDAFGREQRRYLPYVSSETNGLFKQNALTDQSGFYDNPQDNIADDDSPFAISVFEPSPLNRVIKQGSAGVAWQPENGHSIQGEYLINAEQEVYQFSYNTQSGLIALPSDASKWYSVGELQGSISLDEHQKETIEFKDKLGLIVCRKIQYDTVGAERKYALTYYLYDDFGNLVVVLPPEAVKAFTSN